jgi:hypothetical protein
MLQIADYSLSVDGEFVAPEGRRIASSGGPWIRLVVNRG